MIRLTEICGVPHMIINNIKKNGDQIGEFMCKTEAAKVIVEKKKLTKEKINNIPEKLVMLCSYG